MSATHAPGIGIPRFADAVSVIRRLGLSVVCSMMLMGLALPVHGGPLGGVSVRDHGAVGDGQANDTAAFEKAIEAAAQSPARRLIVPAGTYRLTSTLSLPERFIVQGAGPTATVLVTEQAADFDLFAIHDAHHVTVRDVQLIERDHEGTLGEARDVLASRADWADHGYRPSGAGVSISGTSREVLLERVHVLGFRFGFSLGRAEPSALESITLRDCRSETAQQWGFELNHVDTVLLDECRSYRSGLDNFKLRKQARNVTVRGGEASGSVSSSGLDGYAGAENLLIDGLNVVGNHASGIYIKAGPLYYDDFGRVGSVMIQNVRVVENDFGLSINRSGGDLIKEGEDKLPPLVSHVVVTGGIYEENQRSGIYVRGRNVTIQGPIVRRNGHHGIDLASARDVEVIGAQITGNGLESPGGFYGISIGADPVRGSGHRVRIRGGTIDGVDSDSITTEADYAEHEPTHRNAVRIAGRAGRIVIDHVTMRHWTRGPHAIAPDVPDDAELLVHYGHHGTLEAVGAPGSTLMHDGRLHVKASPVTHTGGWGPVQPVTHGPADARPESPVIGQMHFDTDAGAPRWWDGTEWIAPASP